MSKTHGGTWYAARATRREAFAGHRRRVQGDRSFRKLLAKVSDAARDELAAIMEEGGRDLLAAMQADAAHRSGALRAGLSMKLLRKTLRLRVGLIGKPINRRLFYGRIVQFGRKAQTVRVYRRKRSQRIDGYQERGVGRGRPYYLLRVSPLRPSPYVFSRRTDLRTALNSRLTGAWQRILSRASTGLSDD